MDTFTFYGKIITQHGHTLLSTSLTKASYNALKGQIQSDLLNAATGEGSQRIHTQSRVTELAEHYANRQITASNLIFNILSEDHDEAVTELKIETIPSIDPMSKLGMLTIPTTGYRLFGVDGWHRYSGYELFLEMMKVGYDKWEAGDEYELPLSFLLVSREDQLFVFATHNSGEPLSKNHRTALQARIAALGKDDDYAKFLPKKLRKDLFPTADMNSIVNMLYSRDDGQFANNPLKGRLTQPNEIRSDGFFMVCTFGDSFAHISKNRPGIDGIPIFPNDISGSEQDSTAKALLICNFFKALQMKLPDSFSNPRSSLAMRNHGLNTWAELIGPLIREMGLCGAIVSGEEFKVAFDRMGEMMTHEWWATSERRKKGEFVVRTGANSYGGGYKAGESIARDLLNRFKSTLLKVA